MSKSSQLLGHGTTQAHQVRAQSLLGSSAQVEAVVEVAAGFLAAFAAAAAAALPERSLRSGLIRPTLTQPRPSRLAQAEQPGLGQALRALMAVLEEQEATQPWQRRG